jgi:hypothetical protein
MSKDVEKLKTEAQSTRYALQTVLDKNGAKERKANKDKENNQSYK